MTCMELQPKIAKFIDHRLSDDEVIEMMEHIELCDDCMEEVEFHFILIHGFRHLDNDNTKGLYDFQHQFQNFLREYDDFIVRMHRRKIQHDLIMGIVFLMFTFVLLSIVNFIVELFF